MKLFVMVILYLYFIQRCDRFDNGKPQSGRLFVPALPFVAVEQGGGIQPGGITAIGNCQGMGGYCNLDNAVLAVMDVCVLYQVCEQGGGKRFVHGRE